MLQIILTGISLSMDAFAISVTNGLTVKGFKLRHALIMAAYFGAFQFLMPLVGSFLAGTVSDYISAVGPYISFALLAFIGGRMLIGAFKSDPQESEETDGMLNMRPAKLLALAVATSIDALAVGVAMGFDPNYAGDMPLLPACLVIGAVTFIICVGGGMLGRYIPHMSGKKAEAVGGAVLVGIGIKLLIEGLVG